MKPVTVRKHLQAVCNGGCTPCLILPQNNAASVVLNILQQKNISRKGNSKAAIMDYAEFAGNVTTKSTGKNTILHITIKTMMTLSSENANGERIIPKESSKLLGDLITDIRKGEIRKVLSTDTKTANDSINTAATIEKVIWKSPENMIADIQEKIAKSEEFCLIAIAQENMQPMESIPNRKFKHSLTNKVVDVFIADRILARDFIAIIGYHLRKVAVIGLVTLDCYAHPVIKASGISYPGNGVLNNMHLSKIYA